MARTLNRATILGRLGQDPEVRTTPQGSTVCNLSVATSESYKDKNDQWAEITDWHRVTLWDRLADTASKYLKKGSKVYIEGKIRTRTWEDKDGNKRYMTEIIGNQLLLLDPKSSEGDDSGYSSYKKSYSNNEDTAFNPKDFESSENDIPEDDEVPF